MQPQKLSVAVRALGNLLRGNADAVSELFIDQCYSANAAIAHAYFQARLLQHVWKNRMSRIWVTQMQRSFDKHNCFRQAR